MKTQEATVGTFEKIGDTRTNSDGSISTLVDNGDGSIGTLTTECPKLPPLFLTKDGRIVSDNHEAHNRRAMVALTYSEGN